MHIGIFFSKDRREEVVEVEEEPETVVDSNSGERVKVMTQGEWMKGCNEGGEQSFLFQLYNELSSGSIACPNCHKHNVPRKKGDFFALYVRLPSCIQVWLQLNFRSPISPHMSLTCVMSSGASALCARKTFAWLAASQ